MPKRHTLIIFHMQANQKQGFLHDFSTVCRSSYCSSTLTFWASAAHYYTSCRFGVAHCPSGKRSNFRNTHHLSSEHTPCRVFCDDTQYWWLRATQSRIRIWSRCHIHSCESQNTLHPRCLSFHDERDLLDSEANEWSMLKQWCTFIIAFSWLEDLASGLDT